MALNDWIEFDGTAYARSSKDGAKGPPGEAEILKLNPERQTRITTATGWKELEPGTLNLKVDEADVHALATLDPVIEEPPPVYPSKYANIPKKRVGYWYYRAQILSRKGKEFVNPKEVLVRRAVNPCKGVVEVLAPVNVRKKWHVKDGDKLRLKVLTGSRDIGTFIDRYGKNVTIKGKHAGQAAFLVCNGPSLKTINRGPLKFVFTMCVNNGPKALMPKLRPNWHVSVDGPDKFLHTIWRDPTITKFARMPNRNKPLWNSDTDLPAGVTVADCPNVVFFDSNTEFNPDTFLDEDSVNWGNSKKHKVGKDKKGGRSVMLAALKILATAGFSRVYLVGCDFNMDEKNHYAFDQDRKASAIRGNQSTYDKLNWRFTKLRPKFEARGFNVYNCNPDSGLTAFDHVPYEDALADALRHTIDWREYVEGREENTAGLYESKWYVCDCGKSARYTKDAIQSGSVTCGCGFNLTEENRRKYLRDKTQGNIDS
jgi:hypothetical protein